MPTITDLIMTPEEACASCTAVTIELVVRSMWVTTPRVIPSDIARPTPRMFIRPCSSVPATTAQTFVVPMSRPTMILSMTVSCVEVKYVYCA